MSLDRPLFNIFDKKTHSIFIKIQEEFMRMDVLKWVKFRKWCGHNFHPELEIYEKDLVHSLYNQLVQCQKHIDPKIPKSKRKYIYKIPARHSIDGKEKTYEFSYWLTK